MIEYLVSTILFFEFKHYAHTRPPTCCLRELRPTVMHKTVGSLTYFHSKQRLIFARHGSRHFKSYYRLLFSRLPPSRQIRPLFFLKLNDNRRRLAIKYKQRLQ